MSKEVQDKEAQSPEEIRQEAIRIEEVAKTHGFPHPDGRVVTKILDLSFEADTRRIANAVYYAWASCSDQTDIVACSLRIEKGPQRLIFLATHENRLVRCSTFQVKHTEGGMLKVKQAAAWDLYLNKVDARYRFDREILDEVERIIPKAEAPLPPGFQNQTKGETPQTITLNIAGVAQHKNPEQTAMTMLPSLERRKGQTFRYQVRTARDVWDVDLSFDNKGILFAADAVFYLKGQTLVGARYVERRGLETPSQAPESEFWLRTFDILSKNSKWQSKPPQRPQGTIPAGLLQRGAQDEIRRTSDKARASRSAGALASIEAMFDKRDAAIDDVFEVETLKKRDRTFSNSVNVIGRGFHVPPEAWDRAMELKRSERYRELHKKWTFAEGFSIHEGSSLVVVVALAGRQVYSADGYAVWKEPATDPGAVSAALTAAADMLQLDVDSLDHATTGANGPVFPVLHANVKRGGILVDWNLPEIKGQPVDLELREEMQQAQQIYASLGVPPQLMGYSKADQQKAAFRLANLNGRVLSGIPVWDPPAHPETAVHLFRDTPGEGAARALASLTPALFQEGLPESTLMINAKGRSNTERFSLKVVYDCCHGEVRVHLNSQDQGRSLFSLSSSDHGETWSSIEKIGNKYCGAWWHDFMKEFQARFNDESAQDVVLSLGGEPKDAALHLANSILGHREWHKRIGKISLHLLDKGSNRGPLYYLDVRVNRTSKTVELSLAGDTTGTLYESTLGLGVRGWTWDYPSADFRANLWWSELLTPLHERLCDAFSSEVP